MQLIIFRPFHFLPMKHHASPCLSGHHPIIRYHMANHQINVSHMSHHLNATGAGGAVTWHGDIALPHTKAPRCEKEIWHSPIIDWLFKELHNSIDLDTSILHLVSLYIYFIFQNLKLISNFHTPLTPIIRWYIRGLARTSQSFAVVINQVQVWTPWICLHYTKPRIWQPILQPRSWYIRGGPILI